MNEFRDVGHIKSNRAKSTISTNSFSASTKISSKSRLSEIFEYMSEEYPLSDLAETLEKETGGKFTQLTFREILDRQYPDLSISDKIFLIKHLPLSKIGITPYSPLMFILYLFKYIESIIKEKIISPSLIFYDIAERLKYRYDMSTLEYFNSLNLEPENEITIDDFYLQLGSKLGLDEISEIVLFKSIDYDKDNKIKIEDLIIVIDSYRNDNLEEKTFSLDNTAKKSAILLKNFLEKNLITLDFIYENAVYNYLRYNEIKSILVNEIYNYKRFRNKEDTQINDSIVDKVLSVIQRDDKIFKNDFKNYVGELNFNSKNDEEDDKNENEVNPIQLNYKQKYWINKYLDLIDAIKSSPKIIFNSCANKQNENVANIVDLIKQIIRLSPSGKFSTNEMTDIMNSLDINNTGLIEINQYEIIINQVQDLKNKINKKIEDQEASKYNNLGIDFGKKTVNIWSKGVKSPYYHLLPAKGNYEVLEQINQDIKQNLIYDGKENDINSSNISPKKIKKIGKKVKPSTFREGSKIGLDKGAIFEVKDNETGKVEKYYTNDKNMETEKIEILNEYSEEDLVKISLENFNFEEIYFSNDDLLKHLIDNKIAKKTSEEIIKFIDSNEDGKISVMELFKFLLYEMKYKSTKLVLKYLYIKIYKELQLKSSEYFFKNNKFKVQKNINLKKLSNFFETIYIDTPLTRKIYENLQNIFKPPILYIHLCKLIDDSQNESILLEKQKANENNDNSKENNKDINDNLILSFDIDNLDNEMRNVVRNLIDKKDYQKKDSLRCKNLNEKVLDMLSNCSENMNYPQFEENFGKKLNISSASINAIFHLLKHASLKGTNQPLISKDDLLMFLQTYCCETDKSNFISGYNNDKENTDDSDVGLSLKEIKNIVTNIEQNGPPLKYAFEKLKFRNNGYVSSTELLKHIDMFYNNSIPKKQLMNIISCIDEDKLGFVNYTQLQIFLNDFSNINQFSPLLEIQIIACKLYEQNINNSEKYFKKFKKIENFKEIKKKQHNMLLANLCSNKDNKAKLYIYLVNLSGNKFYDLKLLTNKIDNLLQKDIPLTKKNSKSKKDGDDEEENLGLPNRIIVENALKLINLGPKGNVSMNELLLKIKKGYRKSLSEKIDKKHEGFIAFPNFINVCRKIYGTEINLNYKLCAQYLYQVFISSPDKVEQYLLQKTGQKNINSYLDKSEIYNNFMFAFCNDKYMFENFYLIYSEKKGKNKSKLNLKSMQLFIYSNNPELKSLENNIRFKSNNKEQIDSTNKKREIIDILDKKITNVREIIENINYTSSKLQKNFTISEKYFKTLLMNHFNFNDDEVEEVCNYFKSEDGKIDLKKFYEFDPNNERNRNIILHEDILPRIQNHISKSIYKSYKEYKNTNFKSDYLDICELYIIFNKLYNTTLFQCLMIIIGYKEPYLSIETFFKDNNLKNYFPSKDFDPALKLAIVRLNEYIEENYKDKKHDKLKIFKGYDTNKDGILSSEEFITALNSLKDVNLNDNQKIKLYNFADANKDGKINAKEFLDLIKTIKNYIDEDNELNAPLPANSITGNNDKKFIPKILEKDISSIKLNYKANIKIIKNLKNNTFLSCIVKLQLDLINNYYNEECMENDFLTSDEEKDGFVNEKIFKLILRKRIVNIDDEIYNLFIKFASDENEIEEEKNSKDDESSNSENKVKKINYKIFLNKIASYKIKANQNENFLPKIK